MIVAISVFAVVAYYALVIARRLKCAGFTFYLANRFKTPAFAFAGAFIKEFICFVCGECLVYYPVGAGNDSAAIPLCRGCVFEIMARRDWDKVSLIDDYFIILFSALAFFIRVALLKIHDTTVSVMGTPEAFQSANVTFEIRLVFTWYAYAFEIAWTRSIFTCSRALGDTKVVDDLNIYLLCRFRLRFRLNR